MAGARRSTVAARSPDQTGDRHAETVVIHLDRVSAQEVAAEAAQLGFLVEPNRQVPESERYLGSTIVVLRKL